MDRQENWEDTAHRVATHVLPALGVRSEQFVEIRRLIRERKFIPGGRYLYASGRPRHQVQNCLLLRAEDSSGGWSSLMRKAADATMSGAGIGVDYSAIRERGAPIKGTGGFATGPCSLMQAINEIGRQVMGGGSRRAAIWAGLNWSHPDIEEFIHLKDWTQAQRAMKAEDHTFPLPMELTNISVLLDDEFFRAYETPWHGKHHLARDVYNRAITRMLKTGEPGFSIDVGENAGETLRNACTEITSADDSDICNLGSLNIARFESKEEFAEAVDLATLFLLAGTVYSDLPYAEVYETRQKNRRLGLGLMGIHEWLLARGKSYGPDEELAEWLDEYEKSTEYAAKWAEHYGISHPVKTRAIAPTGTIGIIGETTTGIEPIFCVAYLRKWSEGDGWSYDYVVDPTAHRLVDSGVDPQDIEDAYSISPERRIAFQAWIQQWVDHGISSTINLPAPITNRDEVGEFGATLYSYLPHLRGVTVYPDGARAGQPITPVLYDLAVQMGAKAEESDEKCISGVCGV